MKYFFGTQLLSQTFSKETIFDLFRKALLIGADGFETAPNYPMTDDMENFGYMESLLLEWLLTRKDQKIEVLVRIGAIDNKPVFERNNNFSFLVMSSDNYRDKFGLNLKMLIISNSAKNTAVSATSIVDAAKVISANVDIAFADVDYELFAKQKEMKGLKPSWIVPLEVLPEGAESIKENIILEIKEHEHITSDLAINLDSKSIHGVIIQADSIDKFESILAECRSIFQN